MQSRRLQRGTTLLEVLNATLIMGSLLAIGSPQLTALRAPYALRAATQRIAADVRATRMRAIARNTRYRMVFTAGTYTIEREVSTNTFAAEGGIQTLASGVAIGTVNGTAIFDTRGLVGGTVTIPVSNTAGARTVTINALGNPTIG